MSTLVSTYLQDRASGKKTTTVNVIAGSAKAHSGFDQSTLIIYDTLNVASLTDQSVGCTASNFTTPMVDNNYNPFVSTFTVNNNYERVLIGDAGTAASMTCRVVTGVATSTDSIWVTEAAFGRLA